ncbi:MAG: hypothetical protein JO112_04585, partial [Planctomycetes bacterium]|nr:hypothetical protein [Planctomycetota bacterium]
MTTQTSPIPVTLLPSVTEGLTSQQASKTDVVIDWNSTLLQAIWNNGQAQGSSKIYSQPTWDTRALAMMQVAVYDAVDAIHPTAALYLIPNFQPHPARDASAEAAA